MPPTTTQSDYTGRAEANTDYSITGLHQNHPPITGSRFNQVWLRMAYICGSRESSKAKRRLGSENMLGGWVRPVPFTQPIFEVLVDSILAVQSVVRSESSTGLGRGGNPGRTSGSRKRW